MDKTAPIQARDDAKAGRLGQECNDAWRGFLHVPSGLQFKTAISSMRTLAACQCGYAAAPGTEPF